MDTEIARQEEEIKALTLGRNKEIVIERKRHEAAILLQKLFRGFTVKHLSGKGKKAPAKDAKKKK